MYEARYPIERIERVDAYDGDDNASMAANNTSAFNCRTVAGSSTLSQHAFGRAVDINPVQNPYVTGGGVFPPAGEDYVDRAPVRPGMIVRPGPTTSAFADVGWGWGGDFSGKKDYQHFSASGL
jgi:poly-gamma-glutamate synthesis protein (capsule biosynthesis protein)